MKNPFKYSIIAICMALANPTNAEVTYFSRANCVNNESLTWDPMQTYYPVLIAKSSHKWTGGGAHSISDSRTWYNSAKAIHWGEGVSTPGGDYWVVTGIHAWQDRLMRFNTATSSATFCNLWPY